MLAHVSALDGGVVRPIELHVGDATAAFAQILNGWKILQPAIDRLAST